jgi:hypothetical protein
LRADYGTKCNTGSMSFPDEAYWSMAGAASPVIVLATTVTTGQAILRVVSTIMKTDETGQAPEEPGSLGFFGAIALGIAIYVRKMAERATIVQAGLGAVILLTDIAIFLFAALSLTWHRNFVSPWVSTVGLCVSLFLVFGQLVIGVLVGWVIGYEAYIRKGLTQKSPS